MSAEKPVVEIPDGPPSYQLELEDLAPGEGEEAVSGRVVEVHYVGVSWQTGKQFDASWDRGDTFKFGLGKGQVIPGWDQGVAGLKGGGRRGAAMKVGAPRRITIPPNLAYGKRGAGGVIGPDETLVFVVDLIGVRGGSAAQPLSRRRGPRRSRRPSAPRGRRHGGRPAARSRRPSPT